MRKTAWVAVALLWSAPAGAADLRLQLGLTGEYDSNIYNRETKIRDDFVINVVPDVTLLETDKLDTEGMPGEVPYAAESHEAAVHRLGQVDHERDHLVQATALEPVRHGDACPCDSDVQRVDHVEKVLAVDVDADGAPFLRAQPDVLSA